MIAIFQMKWILLCVMASYKCNGEGKRWEEYYGKIIWYMEHEFLVPKIKIKWVISFLESFLSVYVCFLSNFNIFKMYIWKGKEKISNVIVKRNDGCQWSFLCRGKQRTSQKYMKIFLTFVMTSSNLTCIIQWFFVDAR